MQGIFLRKYGVQTTINFHLFEIDGVNFRVDAADGGTDCSIMKDEGDEATCTNDFADEGTGYSLVLTATEMQAARIVVYVVDTATKVWLDIAIVVETYGHASAMHAIDLADSVRAGLTALPNAAADAIGGLPISDAGGLDLDAKLANTNEVTVARMGALTDWINDGRLDLLLDAIKAVTDNLPDSGALNDLAAILTDTGTTLPATLATIAGYLDTEIAAIVAAVITNAEGDDVAADIIALKAVADAIPTTEMRGTNDANTVVPDAAGVAPTAEAIADAVWDEILTGATHNIATSAGKRLREIAGIAIHTGTAQTGTINTITLDVDASSEDKMYNRDLIVIIGGVGTGQTRTVIEYNGTTKVAAFNRDWWITPDDTSEFQILAADYMEHSNHGYAQAGTANSITLEAGASAINDTYKEGFVFVTSGLGKEQARLVTGYNGTTKVALISPDWVTTPDDTSIYHIQYGARKVVDSLGDQAKTDVNAEVLDVMNVDTFVEPGQGAPPATASIFAKINYMYKSWRNKKDNDGSTRNIYADDGATVDQKSTVSEAAGTVTVGEIESGP